jgi:hypothetical protein
MVPRAPPTVVPLLVLKPDSKTVEWLASRWSKPSDFNACHVPSSLRWFYGASDKSNFVWFWVTNQEIVTVILRRKSINRSCQFWWLNRKTWATNFEAKSLETVTTGFEAQTGKPEPPILRSNREKLSPPVLRSNQRKPSLLVLRSNRRKPSQWFWGQSIDKPYQWFWGQTQIVDLGFEAQPRNPRFSSLCAPYRPHTVSPDLPIIRPLSTRPVRPSLFLCTRSPTPVTILVTAYHAAPANSTLRDKQTRFSTWNKG